MQQRIDLADAERLAAEIITPEVVAEAVPRQEVKQPVEDFLEPLEWTWTRSTYRARMLAKEYAEGTESDY